MNEVLQNIVTRRSIRSYKSEQIPDDCLQAILEAARYAPSGSNSQSFFFTVFQDQNKIDRLNALVRDAFKDLVVDGATYRGKIGGKKAAQNDGYHFCYHAPTLIIVSNDRSYTNAFADCSCALQNIFLAAHSFGLGSCWINQPAWFCDVPAFRAFLTESGVPVGHIVCGAAAVGYIEGRVPEASPRKEGNIHIIR